MAEQAQHAQLNALGSDNGTVLLMVAWGAK